MGTVIDFCRYLKDREIWVLQPRVKPGKEDVSKRRKPAYRAPAPMDDVRIAARKRW